MLMHVMYLMYAMCAMCAMYAIHVISVISVICVQAQHLPMATVGRQLAAELREEGAEVVIALTHNRLANDLELAEVLVVALAEDIEPYCAESLPRHH